MRFRLRAPLRIALAGALSIAGEIHADPPTGLIFPANSDNPPEESVRFNFTGAALQEHAPASYVWRYFPNEGMTGYSTVFFWGPNGTFTGAGYYGFAPYPDSASSSGTTHQWEISVQGTDFRTGSAAIESRWYTQAAVVRIVNVGGFDELELKFFYDLPDESKVITFTTTTHYDETFPPASPVLVFGDAPWAGSNECLDGILRGIKTFSTNLSQSDLAAEAANHQNNAAVTAAGIASLWYANVNPTPDDISDKSGAGHHPAWHDEAYKATLWTP